MRSQFLSALLFFICVGTATAGQVKYFPPGVLSDDKRYEQSLSERYSRHLTVFEEPSLWELSNAKGQEKESYRFLWLRTFHHPVSIRVDIEGDGTSHLITKVASGAGGYDPGKLMQHYTIALTKAQTDRFLAILEKNRFWKLPPHDESLMGVDGAQWIIEGVKDGAYHFVDRWSPDHGEVRAIGLSLVRDFAKLKIPAKDVY